MDYFGNVINNNAMTPAEKQLRPILCDDGIQVLSTFELNQVASLTYNDVTCDGIFEFMGKICSKPLDHTPLTLQKSLIVTKHIMIYGSEKTANHAYGLQGYLKQLLEFNTVLMTQKQGGAMSFFQSLQGGGVDKGGPVREAAGQVLQLLGNIHELRRLRIASASEHSLVPIGDNGETAFVTDDVRLQILKRKIAEEKNIRIQSNLKKSEGGFGGGYASKDGRSVVGAAHGIEEMIKMANINSTRTTTKFSDDGRKGNGKTKEEIILEELKAEADAEKAARAVANAPTVDLLGGSFAAQALPTMAFAAASSAGVDLLDFGGSSTGGNGNQTAPMGDFLGGGLPTANMTAASAPADPFGLASAYNTTIPTPTHSAAPIPNPASSSLFDFSVQNDPFAPISATSNQNQSTHNNDNDSMGLMSMGMNHMTMNATPIGNNNKNPMMSMMQTQAPMQQMTPSAQLPKAPMMASHQDRFSALDALAATTTTMSQATAHDARNAENRLLGFSSASMSSSNNNTSTSMASANGSTMMTMMPMMPMGMGRGMGMTPPPPIPEPIIAPGSGQVGKTYGSANNNEDNNDNPWMMGGTTGMGLKPVGPEPTAPPPPPPPEF